MRTLQDHEAATERWLTEKVVPAYDAYTTDPSRGIPIEEVFDGAEARYIARRAAGG